MMSTKIGSQQKQSPEHNTGGGRANTSASRCNHISSISRVAPDLLPVVEVLV